MPADTVAYVQKPSVSASSPVARERRLQGPPLIASFDVFDTLLTRAVGEPAAMALLFGARVRELHGVRQSAEVIARQRVMAAERAQHFFDGDPPLEAIHRELADSLGLPRARARELAGVELALEHRLTRLVPGADDLVDSARRDGSEVVFVSDTHLSRNQLEHLLDAHGVRKAGERCFSSGDLPATKRSKAMFRLVAQELGVHPGRIVHHGDDHTADVRNARLSGWRARHRPQAELNRYEQALEAHRFTTSSLTSAFAGASRLARLAQSPKTSDDRARVEVAAGVVGPVLVGWLLWVLRRAREEGISRLYFVSRDGQVLLDLALRLERVLQTGMELRYLYGSRRAWMLAGFDEHTRLQDLADDSDVRTVRSFANGLGLRPEALAHLLPPMLRDPTSWDENLDRAQRALLDAVLDDRELRSRVGDVASRSWPTLADYLRQEGWACTGRVGLVDVGWRGRCARALATVLCHGGLQMPRRFFFFGLSDDAHEIAGPQLAPLFEAYYFDRAARAGVTTWMRGLEQCIEIFCAADHGTVHGYQRLGNRVQPVLASAPEATAVWGLGAVRATVLTFAEMLLLDDQLVDRYADVRSATRDLLDLFWRHPTPAEVAAWGSFPVEIGRTHTDAVLLAEPVRLATLRGSRRTGTGPLRDHSWPMGAAHASAWPYRLLMRSRWKAKEELPRAKRSIALARYQARLARRRTTGRGADGRWP